MSELQEFSNMKFTDEEWNDKVMENIKFEKCGFTDNSNFSRTFKRINNITPVEFRKKYRK